MILLEVDPESVASFKLERDAPGAVDVHSVTGRHAVQQMKVKARQIHLIRNDNDVQPVEANQNTFMQFRIDLARMTFVPQHGQAFVLEAFDHLRVYAAR